MSLITKIDELFAQSGDAAMLGLKHLAGEVEALKAGGVAASAADVDGMLAGLKQAIDTKVDAFLADRKAAVDAKLAELEQDVVAAIAKLQPQQAQAGATQAPPQG